MAQPVRCCGCHPVDRGALNVTTDLGPLCIEYTPRGIRSLQFQHGRSTNSQPPAFVRQLARQLEQYARGRNVALAAPLDLAGGTDFQRKIWSVLQQIPRGQTRSYRWVAEQAGHPRAVRAAGSACGANPVPILIPCHRVLASDGGLGGFTAGLAWKRKLLQIETSQQR